MYENEQPMTGAAQDRGRSFRFPSFYYTNFFSSKPRGCKAQGFRSIEHCYRFQSPGSSQSETPGTPVPLTHADTQPFVFTFFCTDIFGNNFKHGVLRRARTRKKQVSQVSRATHGRSASKLAGVPNLQALRGGHFDHFRRVSF